MKTLLIINSRFLPAIGGGETYTLELMQHFAAHGWNVHLATQNRGFKKTNWKGCTLHYLEEFDDNSPLVQVCAPMLRKVLDMVKPDVIHVHNIMPYFILSSIVDRNEFPTVLTIHNTPLLPERVFGTFHDVEAEKMFTRQLLANNKYYKLLVGSHYYLNTYAQIAPWIKPDRAEVVYYFPPAITTGQLTARHVDFEGTVRLLFPSRLIKRKGIEECLRALSKLPARFTLSLPGYTQVEDKLYRLHIASLVCELDLVDRVFVPRQRTTPEKMVGFYREADIVLVPSHYEGFGIVALEAMSWGVPVIASEVGGLSEIVCDKVNGLLIKPKSAEAIETAVLKLVNDVTLAQTIIHGGLKTTQERFTHHKHMKQIMRVYKQAIAAYSSRKGE